jgi:hypothetical protein
MRSSGLRSTPPLAAALVIVLLPLTVHTAETVPGAGSILQQTSRSCRPRRPPAERDWRSNSPAAARCRRVRLSGQYIQLSGNSRVRYRDAACLGCRGGRHKPHASSSWVRSWPASPITTAVTATRWRARSSRHRPFKPEWCASRSSKRATGRSARQSQPRHRCAAAGDARAAATRTAVSAGAARSRAAAVIRCPGRRRNCATLMPGEAVGTSDLQVDTTRHRP